MSTWSNATGERAAARQNRLSEARPTVPSALAWLMLGAVALILAVMATAPMFSVEPVVHIAIVVASAIVFASALILIRDLDQPYRGALHRDPTQTRFVRDQMKAELRGQLPCDAEGLPTGVPSFRAKTAPLANRGLSVRSATKPCEAQPLLLHQPPQTVERAGQPGWRATTRSPRASCSSAWPPSTSRNSSLFASSSKPSPRWCAGGPRGPTPKPFDTAETRKPRRSGAF